MLQPLTLLVSESVYPKISLYLPLVPRILIYRIKPYLHFDMVPVSYFLECLIWLNKNVLLMCKLNHRVKFRMWKRWPLRFWPWLCVFFHLHIAKFRFWKRRKDCLPPKGRHGWDVVKLRTWEYKNGSWGEGQQVRNGKSATTKSFLLELSMRIFFVHQLKAVYI